MKKILGIIIMVALVAAACGNKKRETQRALEQCHVISENFIDSLIKARTEGDVFSALIRWEYAYLQAQSAYQALQKTDPVRIDEKLILKGENIGLRQTRVKAMILQRFPGARIKDAFDQADRKVAFAHKIEETLKNIDASNARSDDE